MPVVVSPFFWEWFNIWLVQFLKNLYHEIIMVALREVHSSLGAVSHGCTHHGDQQNALDLTHRLQTSLGMQHSGTIQTLGQHGSHLNHAGHSNHISHSSHGATTQLDLPTLSSVSLLIPQPNSTKLKHEQNTRYSNSNCMLPSHHYRLLTQARLECFHHNTGGSGNSYMPSTAGTQTPAQSMRGQSAPQPSAPPTPQQDMSKTTLAGTSYVSPQNQTPPSRAQFPNFSQYRATQHGNRPTTHPRQQPQQPFMGGAGTSASGPVMYHPTLLFQPQHMGIPQNYQQSRSSSTGYYPLMTQYISYTAPTGHTPPYYYSPNGQQLTASSVGGAGGRASAGTLVQQPGAQAAQGPLPHSQNASHLHPALSGEWSGIRQAPQKRTSHRLPIINPVTKKDIFSEQNSSDSQYGSGESSERQTPQPEPTHSFAEEFGRMVNEAVNQPSSTESVIKTNFSNKSNEVPITTACPNQPHTNAISTCINSNLVKSELLNVNESKNVGNEIIEIIETPEVSAISDSPVVVPKISMNVKQFQKCDPSSQNLVLDNNKNLSATKPQKQNKSKPVVPQNELETQSEIESTIVPHILNLQVVVTSPSCIPVPASMSMFTSTSMSTSTSVSTTSTTASVTPIPCSPQTPTPQPQRVREPRERLRSEDKEKQALKPNYLLEKDTPQLNGPTTIDFNSIETLLVTSKLPTSQLNQNLGIEIKGAKLIEPETDIHIVDNNSDIVIIREITLPTKSVPTATELLSASIEKVAKEQPFDLEAQKADSIAIQAQVKLTQGIASVARNQSESKMKDINLNNKSSGSDTDNGNPNEVTKVDTVKDDTTKNEKTIKNAKNNNKRSNKTVNNEATTPESHENGKDETDKENNEIEHNPNKEEDKPEPLGTPEINLSMPSPPVSTPKYKYLDDQWSPSNKSGKKYYDIGLLMQIKDDPQSKNKPNIPLLEACNVMRTTPILEPITFNTISRPIIDSLLPNYAKNSGIGTRTNTPIKKDGRNTPQSGKGSMKLTPSTSSSSAHRPYISISLSREEVKLNQSKDAWKPTRFKKDNLTEEELKTQELYKKFRGILNKLTPQKFDTLLDKVKGLEINNKARLEGVIDLVFEKAIDEPNFSEAYAAMCSKLSMLKVPSDNAPEQCVNFRALIISKCQNQFITDKTDEQVLKIERDIAECTDPIKKKEFQDLLSEENRRVRMRSVGNVRFIGELYKLKMLTSKIMVYCMTYLIDKLEEEKLECLCKLLTTIGEQVESEVKEQLETVFKKMQDIVDRKSNKISNRVRFMIQDVIDLRRGKWVIKNVVDSQPKMMDQIQKEAEQQQRHIELMNASPGGGFRREDGGRGKRGGEGRRQGSNSFMDNQWKSPRTSYTVDTSKLKAVTQKNLSNIKLAPHHSAWNHGSGAKNPVQPISNSMISLTKNMYSMLENVPGDPTSLNYNDDSIRSGSISVTRSNSGSRSTTAETKPTLETTPTVPVPQEPISDPEEKKKVKAFIKLLMSDNGWQFASKIEETFPVQYHGALATEILNITLEKTTKDVQVIAKAVHHLISSGRLSADNFMIGMTEILEFASDLFIDIPMLYENLAKFIVPLIEKKYTTFAQIFTLCDNIIQSNHGHMFLKTVIRDLKESMGPTFVMTKWQESGLELKQWMSEEQVPKWIEDNKFEFLEGGKITEDIKRILTPNETQSKLLQLMNADENCDCIRGWVQDLKNTCTTNHDHHQHNTHYTHSLRQDQRSVRPVTEASSGDRLHDKIAERSLNQDNIAASSTENWFVRTLSQAICEHALYGPESRDVLHFSHERMNKFAPLISEYGETREQREANCLYGIQHLIYKLQHPPGVTLKIFQYLHEQDIISAESFIAWEESEIEPEGKGVILKALTSFFTDIKEADNEESCSED